MRVHAFHVLITDKGVHAFSKNINTNVNVIARLEFELAFFKAVVQQLSHYTTFPVEIRWEILHTLYKEVLVA